MSKRSFSELKITPELMRRLRAALAEDVGAGDVTTSSIVPERLRGFGELIAKQDGVLCGGPLAQKTWQLADKNIKVNWLTRDGENVKKGQRLAWLGGRMRGLLIGERLALNFLQRLSGVATLTSQFVEAAGGADGPLICDTRKTTPGWRDLERYAVRVGGGTNHRAGLYDVVLIKENHARAAGGLGEAIELARKGAKGKRIIAEARDRAEVAICCEHRVNLVMLDNFTPARARRTIEEFRSAGIPFEVSGGVNLRTVAAFARTGTDRISVGALTHSAPALDISLQLYQEEPEGFKM